MLILPVVALAVPLSIIMLPELPLVAAPVEIVTEPVLPLIVALPVPNMSAPVSLLLPNVPPVIIVRLVEGVLALAFSGVVISSDWPPINVTWPAELTLKLDEVKVSVLLPVEIVLA
jgi:hypothetical protein